MPDKIAEPKTTPEATHVIVRAYPKVVFFYMTWIVSVLCGMLQPENVLDRELSAQIGLLWLAVFTFNVLVISFEFSRIRSVALTFFTIAVLLAAYVFGYLDSIFGFFADLQLVMNKTFYYCVGGLYSIIFLLVWINSRFSYWEIQPNEILHHHGFLGDVHRYPTRGLHMKKEITDVLEYVLLRSGTLVLIPLGEERPIVLQNVIGMNSVEDKIQRLLGTLKVRIDAGQIGGTD